MYFDAHIPLGEIRKSQETLVRQILEIQNCIIPRSNLFDCAYRLRLLRTPVITINEMANDLHRQRTLYLADKNKNPFESNYVAVSYCWRSFKNVDRESTSPNYKILSSGQLRANKAPNIVLDRAISFAIARGIPFIWIDQEYIKQNDPSDKEIMIQVINKIFSSCKYSIRLLDTRAEPQVALYIFTRLLSQYKD